MDFQELKKHILEHNPKANIELIQKAYRLSERSHKDQKRASGEPYFIHLYACAEIVVEMGGDTASICAALLHDVVEDTPVTKDQIAKEFGDEIANIVQALTNLRQIKFETKEEYKAENIRKILIASMKDIRVILVKLADKLHNMRTLQHFREDKRKRIAEEVHKIYSPIAHKLGMNNIKAELDDLALKWRFPEVYRQFEQRLAKDADQRDKDIKRIIETIKHEISLRGIKAEVFGRAKSFFSIYKKMVKKHKEFNEIFDVNAVRIITGSVPDCYSVLGIIHDLWKPMPGKFKDYIAVPKSNGYQSLHTVVIGPHGKILEVQIRTWEMHHLAEEGIAAHWRYSGTERDKKFDKKVDWLKQVLEWMRHSDNASDFIETLKIDFLKDEIVAFTPKGDPISLPEGSTPIDFAYEIHTSIGNRTAKAKVNNKMVQLDTVLKSGDIVDILTSKSAKPNRQWLNFVRTTKAKNKIRQAAGLSLEHSAKQARLRHQAKQKETGSNPLDHLEIDEKDKSNVKLSKCCNPGYMDDIESYKTRDNRITIHKVGCPNIAVLKGKARRLDLNWKKELKSVRMTVVVQNRVGLLAEMLDAFAAENVDISSVNSVSKKDRIHVIFEWTSPHIGYLEHLTRRIKEIRNVVDCIVDMKTIT
ncbi:bifunctional (p)ppGpp synthetase/guanosine-3',5'-bis(diphosphate) 3'-pyrophosphohydrolase [Candidatus Woesearchaeota archaeon]|nr:bifunctional (p)ppGpp synthetase/guanosine-3',5'-bis(diphosphate) 3'-pyrophosphohydrolase [Candidatus Woesearchaeota archaeon]